MSVDVETADHGMGKLLTVAVIGTLKIGRSGSSGRKRGTVMFNMACRDTVHALSSELMARTQSS